MDLEYTPEERAFRERVRSFLAEHLPRAQSSFLPLEAGRAWQRKLHQAGLLGAAWPKEHGGAGLSSMQQAILNEELALAGAPHFPGQYGIWWVGPAILRFGSASQKRRYLERILSGEDIWATGYSEPNAGSDMFNVQTRAERAGGHYVVNGQKTWSSIAHLANRYFCLVRVPVPSAATKYDGLTVLLMDLHAPGIEVRPIRQITGESDFNEVFLTDVRVPLEDRLGGEGEGWRIISAALVDERTGVATGLRFEESLGRLIDTARRMGRFVDPVWRERVARLVIAVRIAKFAGYRATSDALHGRDEPHLSAAMKLRGTQLAQELSTAAVDLLGAYGQLDEAHAAAPEAGRFVRRFLEDRGVTIGGGTSEIQKNIIAERILGLPRH